ncbi:MAG: hypothetical protein KAU03_05060, partial [Candidatus Altiarchaeales archaeon]|nr:hypothetical protein [Candidatus Altiarchaeales archaeon]
EVDQIYVDVLYAENRTGADFTVSVSSETASREANIVFEVYDADSDVNLTIIQNDGCSPVMSGIIHTDDSGYGNYTWHIPDSIPYGGYTALFNAVDIDQYHEFPILIKAPYTLSGTLKNAEGTIIPATTEIFEEGDEIPFSSGDEAYNTQMKFGVKYRMRFTPVDHLIEEVEIRGIQNVGDSRDILKINRIGDGIEVGNNQLLDFKQAYSIRIGALFDNATLKVRAEGSRLYKCADFDFEAQRCGGSWAPLKSITPGGIYSLTLTSGDPGYAEAGLVSVNTNKSLYHPSEVVGVIMVVLDWEGHLVSNADVVLNVTLPNSTDYIYTTDAGQITETDRGVYETRHLETSLTGNYSLFVNASASGVSNYLESYFTVRQYFDFDILRDSPVVTDPWRESVTTRLKVVSLNSSLTLFNFTERIPVNFTVLDSPGASVTGDVNYTYMKWSDLVNNSQVSYTARPPLKTPYLWRLGQSFIEHEYGVFTEARPWYLAVDPDTIFFENWDDGNDNGWTDADNKYSTSVTQKHSGTHSEWYDGSFPVGDRTLTKDDAINLSGYTGGNVTFWIYLMAGMDAGDYCCLDLYDGSTWYNGQTGTDDCADGNSDPEGSWQKYYRELNTTFYVSGFNIRIRCRGGNDDDAYIDDINVTANLANQAPAVQTPKTLDNETLEAKTGFERSDGMTVRVNVTDGDGASDISDVLIEILNTTGGVKVNNATMTNISSITDGCTYEHNWTIPSDADLGTWNITVYANDTSNTWGSNTANFTVYEPNLTNVEMKTYRNSSYSDTDKFFDRQQTIFVEANVTDQCGEDITDATVTANFTINSNVEKSITLTYYSGPSYRGNWTTNSTSTVGVYNITTYANNSDGNATGNNNMHLYSGENVSAYYMDYNNDGVNESIMESKHLIAVFNETNATSSPLMYLEQKDTNVSYTFGSISASGATYRAGITLDTTKSAYYNLTFEQDGEGISDARLKADLY